MSFLVAKNLQLSHIRDRGIFSAPLEFQAPHGALTLLLGKNGEGKSTLFQALLGEISPISGKLNLYRDGNRIEEPWREIAYVPQDHPYQAALLVEHFLRLAFLPELGTFGQLQPLHHQAIDDILRKLELSSFKSRRMGAISAGERQRVFLARALLQRSSLLLLDEPTNHLDPSARELFWSTVQSERKQRGFDVLAISHDLEFVRENAEWIIALRDRNIAHVGKPPADTGSLFRKVFW